MEIETTLVGDVIVLELRGDLTSRKILAAAFWSQLHKGKSKFILNFEKVRAINSVGMSVLLEFKRLAEATGGALILCRVSVEIYNVLSATQLEEVFNIFDDEDLALTGLIKGLPLLSTDSSVSRYRN